MSALRSRAVSRIFCAGTMTPRSITSKLLHWSTTPTMFLPMSWTSPLTVAITTVPFGLPASPERRLLGLDERNEVADRLLHHARALHHLRQEHLAGAEEVADDVHPGHQRALDHVDRAPAARGAVLPRLLGVLDDVRRDAANERVRQPLVDGSFAPGEVLGDLLPLRLERLGEGDEPLGRVRAPVENDVLDALAQLGRNLVVHAELAGVDDAHRHPGADRVVEEHRVDRLAHRVVAAETRS